jgi:iron complex transport system permease protein
MSRRFLPYLTNLGLLLLAVVFSLAIGSVFIAPENLGQILRSWLVHTPLPAGLETYGFIISDIRLPRTILVLLTGAALGGSGTAYQGLFRNPLADPYLIGVASGGGLGAVLAMSIQWPYTFWGLMAVPLSAFLFAMLTVLLVYSLARVGKSVPTTNLILAGVAFSAFATALTSYLIISSEGEVRRALNWLMGGSNQSSWLTVLAVLPYLVLGLGFLLFNGHALTLLQFADDQAQQLGLPVTRTKTLLLVAASLATAAAVSFSGIIGFIGLIVPHVMRLWWGADYRRLLPLSMLAGGSFLILADILARIVLRPQELPVGIVTALAGAPFFLWVLRRSKNQGYW